ncbi:MAG: phosphosulfolactate synthase, partial [Usitatibacteraceae bacterium]
MDHNFLDTPERSCKPRERGITSLIDNGVPTKYFIDVIESSPSLIDYVKFGWCTAMVTPDLEKKIECLVKNNVDYYFGGTLFEKALSQNKLDPFYKFLKKFNCKVMEVSDGTLTISSKDKARHIADFAKEFCVFSEVGKKDIEEADNMPISQWIDEIHHDLAAGASKVILESRESGKSGICDANGNLRPDLVSSITKSRFRAPDALWEAPNKALQTSLISSIGPTVNLANIAFTDVIGLETKGNRGRALGFMPRLRSPLPPNTAPDVRKYIDDHQALASSGWI